MLAGHRTAGLSEVCFPGFDRGLFWGQGVSLSFRDVGFIWNEWL